MKKYKDSCFNGLGVSNKNEDKTRNLVQWVRGPVASYSTGVQSLLSPAFIPKCSLQEFLRSYFSKDTFFVNHVLLNVMDYADIIQISWASLGNN